MGFSTRYPWRQLKITIRIKNGFPFAISLLFAPSLVIIPILLDLSDCFESGFSLYIELESKAKHSQESLSNEVKNPRLKWPHGHKSTAKCKGKG